MLTYTTSKPLTMGVELELQLLNARDFALSRDAPDLINLLHRKAALKARITPEITESMIELNTSIHSSYDTVLQELRELRNSICEAGDKLNIDISGGGAHPVSVWKDRRIYPTERFLNTSHLYGYLAKQFTVFGQHVHIGCPDGDSAVQLTHMLAPYIPYFIALSAASPYASGEDTSFETARLHAVAVFPLSGHMPRIANWENFNHYFDEMLSYGIVKSMKDFYWDIRPKPEFGTVEVRIFDTPLTVEMAAALAALVQALSSQLLASPPDSAVRQQAGDVATYRVYGYNRFQACRFGYEAMIVDARTKQSFHLGQALERLLEDIMPVAAQLGSVRAIIYLQELVAARQNGASWMRAMHAQSGDLSEVMRTQAALFRHSGQHAQSSGRHAPGRGIDQPLQRTEPTLGAAPALHSVPAGKQLAA
jgi:glutamate---cysteine ligase / carboxylate-amine ligase